MKITVKKSHLFLKSCFFLSFAILNVGTLSADEPTNAELMKVVVDEGFGNLPEGYSDEVVEKPRLSGTALALRLSKLTRKKVKDWRAYVTESEEFDHLTPEERSHAARNPKETLGVPYLLEIQEVKAIKKDGVIIGYIFDVADHVQADIYQDGAWYYFYTDDKFEVVGEEENAA